MFIIKTAFWLSLVILLLPVEPGTNSSTNKNVGAADAVSAARTTIGDLGKFCQRNPDTCETGYVVLSSFGEKARYGAQMVYEYLDDKFGPTKDVQLLNPNTAQNS